MGNLLYFDFEEHQIPTPRLALARVPKLGPQWRIIHDFKPTEYHVEHALSFKFVANDPLGGCCVRIGLHSTKIILQLQQLSFDLDQANVEDIVESSQLPKIGEWTKIEVGHENVDGKFFLYLSIGGREVGRTDDIDPRLRKLTDVRVFLGSDYQEFCQPGFIRRLVVLEN